MSKNTTSELELTLPYPELTDTLSRDQIHETLKQIGGKRGRTIYRVPLAQITIRENFNWRMCPPDVEYNDWLYEEKHLDITTLANGILASGGAPPLLVDMSADGTFIITDGFRRYHALNLLIENGHTHFENGHPIDTVEVLVNPKETTELDRMMAIFTTQENKKLRAVEVGHGFIRIKKAYGFSNEKLAEMTGKSRQWVDQKIALANEPLVIQKAVEGGQLSATAALAMKNNIADEKERVAMVQESIDKKTQIKVGDIPKKGKQNGKTQSALMVETILKDPTAAKPAEHIPVSELANNGNGQPVQTEAELKAAAKEFVAGKLSEAVKRCETINQLYLPSVAKEDRKDFERMFAEITETVADALAYVAAS